MVYFMSAFFEHFRFKLHFIYIPENIINSLETKPGKPWNIVGEYQCHPVDFTVCIKSQTT